MFSITHFEQESKMGNAALCHQVCYTFWILTNVVSLNILSGHPNKEQLKPNNCHLHHNCAHFHVRSADYTHHQSKLIVQEHAPEGDKQI